MGTATHSAVPSDLWIATLLGASSPKTMCNSVMMAKATAAVIASAARTGRPSRIAAGSIRWAKAGSPIQPKASDASVMPSWVADRYSSRLRTSRAARLAAAEPRRASSSSRVGRTFTSANSVATKKPFKATSANAATTASHEPVIPVI